MKYFILVAILILMSGCSLFEKPREDSKPVVVERRVATIPVFHPPLPGQASLITPKFKVWNVKTLAKYLKEYEAGNAPAIVIYGLSSSGYENLGTDIKELTRVIKGYREIIIYYRTNVNDMPAPEPKQKAADGVTNK